MKTTVFQFGILRLLVLTTVVALITVAVTRLRVPQYIQIVAAVYFTFLVGWVILRAPRLYQTMIDLRMRGRRIQQERDATEAEIARLRDTKDVLNSKHSREPDGE